MPVENYQQMKKKVDKKKVDISTKKMSSTSTEHIKIYSTRRRSVVCTSFTNVNVNRFWLGDDAVTLMGLNPGMDEETVKKLHWDKGVARIVQGIGATGSSIVCLENMCKMSGSEEKSFFKCPELKNFECEDFSTNGTRPWTRQWILYDKTQWFCLEKGKKWLSSTYDAPSLPDGIFDRCVGYVKLAPVDEDGKIIRSHCSLYVFASNFSFGPEERKWRETKRLVEIVRSVTGGNIAAVCGDLNFFDDSDGGAMRKYLNECFTNIGENAVYSHSGERATRTYTPYSYEKSDLGCVGLNSNISHIYLYAAPVSENAESLSIEEDSVATLFTQTFLDEESGELPSSDDMPFDYIPLRSRVIRYVF